MADTAQQLAQLMRMIRQVFQDMKTLGDTLYEPLGINASMRSVLEHLHEHEECTVPDIARVKNVSRQHVQKIVDQLLAAGLVALADNPAHKRSKIIVPSEKGASICRKILDFERRALLRISNEYSARDLSAAHGVLASLHRQFREFQAPGAGDTPMSETAKDRTETAR